MNKDNFSVVENSWTICQRNNNNLVNILFKGKILNFDKDSIDRQHSVCLLYENTGASISSRFDGLFVNVDENGFWQIMIEDVPAGGPYRFQVYAHDINGPYVIHNIGVGDIWIIAGQSNAGGFTGGAISDPPEIGVHKFTSDGIWELATHPIGNGWGHSQFLHFGKILKNRLNIPIGIVPLAIGGSSLSEWNPAEGEAPYYNRLLGVIRKLQGNVKGLLWYQGCSDTFSLDAAETYLNRFGSFIKQLRMDMCSHNLPIITAQLNKFLYREDVNSHLFMSILRENQRLAPTCFGNVGIIPTIDCSLCDSVHTSAAGNIILGERFANAALGMVYGFDIEWKAPNISEAYVQSDRKEIFIKFTNTSMGLTMCSSIINSFIVKDEVDEVHIEDVQIHSKDIVKITLQRPLGYDGIVHGQFESSPVPGLRRLPDLMPALCFYNICIKELKQEDTSK